ncbi:hypothetical protein VB715_18500 [Crocosphaera sp. UHCC 0190]|uniref:hypothetical protein n=1 Tax=Crocosphaera sp. UHCC 0190 TaxID=3110246 RepID=UPI002B1F0AA2|nr:hypothetical protein [Crocosphaera sp. UHCC 0190]MEA5511766.1 hypothetical protein [Crocosphaera sp. UHCC 0190]
MNRPQVCTLLLATTLLLTASPVKAENVGTIEGPGLRVTPSASSLPYGRNTCQQGFVWREAYPGDVVCVTPQTRSQTAYDNSQVSNRIQPGGGPYGPYTCRQGYVWREATQSDLVCVTPETRSQAAQDNNQAASRRVIP